MSARLAPPIAADLAVVMRLLSRPVSAQERDRARLLLVAVVRRLTRPAPAGRAEAEAALLDAAQALAGAGLSEMDIRAVLEGEAACLDRAHARREGPK